MLVCGIVFILIQNPYIIEEQKISIDVKQASASELVVYENTDKLVCKYTAKDWNHYVLNKDEAIDFYAECEDKITQAKKVIKQDNDVFAYDDVLYVDKTNKNTLKTDFISYNTINKVLNTTKPATIISDKTTIKAKNGIKYDMKNGVLDMENFYMSFKDNK